VFKSKSPWALGASMTALAAILSAAPAGAQTQAPNQPVVESDDIVVTGFRGSLAKALSQKQNEVVAVDSILAEDIGKFPDLNLSESLQRLPGVAITREGGEGRNISVRGLGPQYTRVRINGMEALSTTGGVDATGGVNRGRGFDFSVFASDLFNELTVRKTAEAATEEGSIGATVDLQTAHPFDYNKFTFVASSQLGYNELSEATSPRAAALISNTWADGKFGALLSVAYSKRKLVDNGPSTVRWATGNAFSPGFESAAGGLTLAQANAAYHPRFVRYDQYLSENERVGVTGALQWAPDDKTSLTLDVLYADFKGTREEQYLESPSFSVGAACTVANRPNTCGIADTNVLAGVIKTEDHNVFGGTTPQTTLVSGTFDDVDLRVENRFDELQTKFTQYSLHGERELTDRFKISGAGGYSKSDFDNPTQTTLTFDQFNVDGFKYDYSNGRAPLIDWGNAQLTDPNAWRLTQIRIRPQTSLNTYKTLQLNGEFAANDLLTLHAGASWKKYEFSTTSRRRSNGTSTNQEATIPAGVSAIPLSNYSQIITYNASGLDAPAGSTPNYLAPDYGLAVSLLSLNDPTAFGGAFRVGPEPDLGNNNGVEEEDTGAFVQADWNTQLGEWGFRGNLGVRYVKTNQTSRGYSFLSGAAVPVVVERDYSDTLPALNLILAPTDEFQIRFGAAKVMSRPNLGTLTPGATLSVSGANRTATAGNPLIEPFRANTYDLAFEYYFDRGALISVALFKKQVGTFVQTLTTNGPFTGNPFGLPVSLAASACGATPSCDASSNWQFSAPFNTPGGDLDGYEINYQQPLRFLPGALANTGILLNYTSVKSSIQYLNAAGAVIANQDLLGLSRNSYNATLYYEDDKFSARVSAAYRSRYLTRVPGQEVGTDFDGTNETLNVDASMQYSLNDHLKLTLEGVNLTDEFQDLFNDSSNRLSYYHHTGREVLAGIRYSF
jgi:TonB-dependent receptor